MVHLAETARQNDCEVLAYERLNDLKPDPVMGPCHVPTRDDATDCLEFALAKQPEAIIARPAQFEQTLRAELTDQLYLSGPTRFQIDLLSDWPALSAFLSELSIATPPWRICTSLEEAGQAFKKLSGSVTLSPLHPRTVSHPVKVDDLSNFVDGWRTTLQDANDKQVLMTQAMDGRTIKVEGLCQNGGFQSLACADVTLDNDGRSHLIYPSLAPVMECDVLIEAVSAMASRLDLDSVYIDSDWSLGPDGPILMSMSTGCQEPALKHMIFKSVLGISLSDMIIGLALGIPQHVSPDPIGAGVITQVQGETTDEAGFSDISGFRGYNALSNTAAFIMHDHSEIHHFLNTLSGLSKSDKAIAR